MKYIIQKVTSKNINDLFSLYSQGVHEDFPEYEKRVQTIYTQFIYPKKYFKGYVGKRKKILLGSFYDGKLIGFITGEEWWGGVCFCPWFIVAKSHRGKGVGTMLLSRIEQWSLHRKLHYIFLYTENMKNVHFYEHRGYRFAGTQRLSWFGNDFHLMEKSLADKPFEKLFKVLKKRAVSH